jgi:hypothetical protein
MKKTIIGALVGAIIIFAWQFLSFGLANLHGPAQTYTDKQDVIMSFLKNQGIQEGGYLMPTAPSTASRNEMEAAMKASDGKPWARIEYHDVAGNNTKAMMMNMLRGLLVNILTVLLLCWIIGKMNGPTFRTIVATAMSVGLIAFLNEPYTGFIWYKTFDIWAYFLDAIVAWGLTGLWLGWWLRRQKPHMRSVRIAEREKELA